MSTFDFSDGLGSGSLSKTPLPDLGPDAVYCPWIITPSNGQDLLVPRDPAFTYGVEAGFLFGTPTHDIANVLWTGKVHGALTAETVNLASAGGTLTFQNAQVTADFATTAGSITFDHSFLTIQQSELRLGAEGTGVYLFDSSTVSVADALVVDGTCDLTIHFGSTHSESLTIGQGATSSGHVTVDRASLESGDFFIGSDGIGNFTIENGATVEMSKNDGAFLIGANAGGQGFVTVTGESAEGRTTLDLSRTGNAGAQPYLALGASGSGVLNVEDHALLRTQTAYMGLHPGSTGTINLDNAGLDRPGNQGR
jgi:T5SS/PEP-CTERM-associated repeat protein